MMSYPWDSIVEAMGDDGFPIYDRDYKAADLQSLNGRIFSNGVFMDEANSFVVTQAEGMNVLLSQGWCCINGTFGHEEDVRELAIQSSNATQDRIDTIVLRWNANIEMRNIDVYVKTGVASDVPVRPQLTRDSTVYEIGIADIFVARGSGAVSAARITDTRLQTDRCGAVTPFMQLDTTTFFNQLQAQTQIAVDLAQSAIDETLAGELQSQIDELDARCPFPVGAVLNMTNDANPNDMYANTTWEKMEGRFLLGSSTAYALGLTGGEATHTLVLNEIPSHNHGSKTLTGSFDLANNIMTNGAYALVAGASGIMSIRSSNTNQAQYAGGTATKYTHNIGVNVTATHTHDNNGGNGAHNNMPPYEVVNMWKRTA